MPFPHLMHVKTSPFILHPCDIISSCHGCLMRMCSFYEWFSLLLYWLDLKQGQNVIMDACPSPLPFATGGYSTMCAA